MTDWIDGQGRRVRAESTAKVELCLYHAPGAVIISSNPRLAVPNFGKCRRDKFCRCAACKPSLVQ